MNQQELDDAYDQTKYAPNASIVINRYSTNSEETTKRLGEPSYFSYGPTAAERCEIYPTTKPNAPILIYIHGGAWLITKAKDYRFPAEAIINAGAHYVILDFTTVTATGGDLMPLAEQTRRAVAWVAKNAARFGGDPNRIYICGHSSGGHLGGVVVSTDWKEYGAPPDVVKGAVLVSGMYDLKPVRLSSRSRYLNLTDETEHALSAQRHLASINCPITLVYGSFETPEFQRQSRDFAAALSAAGRHVTLNVVKEYNHFEVVESLANPYGAVGRATLSMMRLGTP